MSDISILARVLNGALRNVDLSANALVVGSLKVGAVSPTELTKAILDRLVSLQNGTDVDATYHTHDGRYYTESELGSTGGTSGASLIGVNGTPTNYSPSANNVQKHLEAIDTALGTAATSDFSDAMFRISDDGDPSKKIAFQASGISASTVRTITMPDANVNLGQVNTSIQQDGSRAFTANQPMGGFKLTGLAAGSGAGDSVRYEQAILVSGANAFAANQSFGGFKATNLADPTSGQDAVTLAYMNARLAGIKPKAAARVASTANISLLLPVDPSPVDGVTLADGDRILLKDQTLPEENGIYDAVTAADPTTWTRSSDFDSLSPIDEINGAWLAIQEGTANAGKIYVQFGTVATLGTDPVTFEYFNPIAGLIGGDMITFAGSTFSVDLATVSGLESSNPGNVAGQLRIKLEASNPSLQIDGSNQLGVKLSASGAITSGGSGLSVAVDNSTIEISSNALRVKDAGITLAKLASNSVDENKIVSTSFNAAGAVTGGSGSKIAVQVDGSTIEISANALRVKDAGVTAAKLNTNAFDQDTITGGAGSAAAVQSAPRVKESLVAGESFAANTSFLVRWAVSGETAGRVYKADKDASVSDKFYAFGIALSAAGVSAGGSITVSRLGAHTLGSSDTPFGGTDIGKPVFLGSAGAFILGASLANTANEAQVRIGIVKTTSVIDVSSQFIGVA